ncbi:MAG: chorismate-binding protein, partial [Proteobacteria bacterium]|nr:chorismate-binding protein [Pseudomonadota bacterium]
YLGGSKSQVYQLFCDLKEVSWDQIRGKNWHKLQQESATNTYLGLLSYDDFANHLKSTVGIRGVFHPDWQKSLQKSDKSVFKTSKLYQSASSLIWSQGQFKLIGNPSQQTKQLVRQIDQKPTNHLTNQTKFQLVEVTSKADYLRQIKSVLSDIKNGRYYQLNLLRRFVLPQLSSYQELRSNKELWLSLMAYLWHYSENMSVLLCVKGQMVVSFSPERFVRTTYQQDGAKLFLESFPIKGTAPRGHNTQEDQRLKRELNQSFKDQRELNMIIDLMRNDMASVSWPGSVKVQDPGSVHSFASVFHRQGHIISQLCQNVTLESLLCNLLPIGSITGTPKKEVVTAISEYEQCSRGYFMGSVFLLDRRGFDSSVLIRTLVLNEDGPAEYAAGSGLICDSDALKEYAEIKAKCAMWY